MRNLFKRVELLTNVAILIVAILLSFVLVKDYVLAGWSEKPPQPAAVKTLAPGDKLPLAGFEREDNGRTLLLVLQKGCQFCTESAPFYQRLVKETSGRSDLKLVALLPQPVADGKQYLDEIGVSIADVRQVSPAQVNARGTPTLILVNKEGVVVDLWKGKLPSDAESEVLSKL